MFHRDFEKKSTIKFRYEALTKNWGSIGEKLAILSRYFPEGKLEREKRNVVEV